ncbi:MAG: hypothetical protein JWP85_1554 [Rhodoglobus sp.]|nr:hypothetical protein [Rhodoglobus sp.]
MSTMTPTTPAALDSSPARKRARRSAKGATTFAWGLILPAFALVLAVTVLPVARAFELSLHATEFLNAGEFVGLDNYISFFSDPSGLAGIGRTIAFTVGSLALTMPIGVGLALLLNRRFRGRTLVRTLLILPWVVSQLLAGLMWRWSVSPDIGPFGFILSAINGERTDVLANPTTAMLTLIVVNVWRTYPYAMVLALAALQSIPEEIRESARVEGASAFQELRLITLPLIRSTLLIATIVLTINAVNMVDLPLVMTGGGPVNGTDLLGLRVYREAFTLDRIGFASAIAVVMFIINVLISIVYVRVLRGDREPKRS